LAGLYFLLVIAGLSVFKLSEGGASSSTF